MTGLELSAEQEAEAVRLAAELRPKMDEDILQMCRLLASRKTGELFGETEYALRDGCHRMGASALQAAVNGRKKGGTKVRA